ncbi:MAG TPA: PA domain-containing protein [Candidatus Krumholzibacteria bacterium]|nr:PA domain-containing protein [Candidatus Krumholzibacteria bacterium]
MTKRIIACLLLLALLPAASSFGAAQRVAAAGATITIINGDGATEGFNDPTAAAPIGGNPGTTVGQQRLIAFQFAADLWANTLDSNVEIKVDAQFNPLACTATAATLGSAGTIFIYANFVPAGFFPGPAFPNTWYSSALAKKRAGFDINPGALDIRARFNSNLGNAGCLPGRGWYYGLDGNHGTQIDLVAVLLHELGHGLGFQQFASLATGAQTSGLTDIYGRQLLDLTTNKTWNQMTNAERVASAINPLRVVWTGPEVTAAVPSVLSLGTPLLRVTAPGNIAGLYGVGAATFGPQLSSPGLSGDVVLANDGVAPVNDACSAFAAGSLVGKIALVDRGICAFVDKVKNAQNAGAIGVIVADNVAGAPPPGLGGADPTIVIPSVRISLADGNTIKAALLGGPVQVTLGVDPAVYAGADANGRALVNTPNPVQGGSSVSHWDPSAFRNLLMEPFINDDLTHSVKPPEDLTLPLFRDIGWFPDDNLNGIPNDLECVFACPQDLSIPTDPGRCDAVFEYDVPTTGICGTVTGDPPSGAVLPLGTTTVNLTSETGVSCSFDVTVEDGEAPVISDAAPSSANLWSPNHGMRNITVAYDVADNCPDGGCVLSVTSDEPVDGLGDGDTAPDWEVLDAHQVRLRSERSGTGDGRTYTVSITCTDAAGNTSVETVHVNVPFSSINGRGRLSDAGTPAPEIEIPREVSFDIAGSNPPVDGTVFRFGLPMDSQVELVLFDVAGRRVGTLVQGNLPAGWHTTNWKLQNTSAGIYFARMTVSGQVFTRRVVMLR